MIRAPWWSRWKIPTTRRGPIRSPPPPRTQSSRTSWGTTRNGNSARRGTPFCIWNAISIKRCTAEKRGREMKIITVNVGQGALAIVRHQGEAIIVDSRIPPSNDRAVAYVKEIMALSLKNHSVKGLILTGFDDDHSE